MKFTNLHGIPQGVFEALTGGSFDLAKMPDNIFWATRLINPPKIAVLEKRHWGELEVDAGERVKMFIGNAVHSYLRYRIDDSNRLTEEKAYIRVSDMGVVTLPVGQYISDQEWYSEDDIYVSAKLDCYEQHDENHGTVDDYKATSVWGVIIDGKPKPDWVAQNNIYAYAIRKIGFPVTEMRNILFLTDWSKSKVGTDNRYPRIPIHVWDKQSIWSDEKVQEYIRERIRLHLAAAEMTDDQIPACTPDERWAKAPKWAVMKDGRKSAVKLHSGEGSANAMASELGGTHYVQHRPGEDVRCSGYCSAGKALLCNHYNATCGKK